MLRKSEVINVIDILVLDAKFDHVDSVVQGDDVLRQVEEVVHRYELNHYFLGGGIEVDEGVRVRKAIEH